MANLFTAVFVSRVIFDWVLSRQAARRGVEYRVVLSGIDRSRVQFDAAGHESSQKGAESSVEFFRNPNIDFLGKKWYFLAFSLVFSVAGVFSMLFWHDIPLGVDFRGGTLVYVKFTHTPDDNAIRAAMERAGLNKPAIADIRAASQQRSADRSRFQETSEQALDQGKDEIIKALETNAPAGQAGSEQRQLSDGITDYLLERDPLAPGHRRQPALHRPSPGHRRLSRQDQGRRAGFD